MRQIFFAHPYVCPREPERIAALIRQHGTMRIVAAGEILKRGGDPNRLFLLEEGVCAYFVAGEVNPHPAIMSLILPGTTMCDMTSSVGRRCNVETRAIRRSRLWVTGPDFFDRHVFTVPELAREKYAHAIAKQESTLEGMIANFTLPPAQRLKVLFKAMLLHCGRFSEADPMSLPYAISAETVGQTVNLTRQSVTEILGDWRRQGLLERFGRDLVLKPALFDDIYDWIEHRDGCRPDWRTG